MILYLLLGVLALGGFVAVLFLFRRFDELEKALERADRGAKDDMFRSLQSITSLTESNERRLDGLRDTLEKRLMLLQEDNNRKLEQMRATVDEKLHASLEKRLGESFKLVGERLEQVHKGLGEMQSLAAGVGDLKKVLSNVKTRGTWGEIQLGNLLEQVLTAEQYSANVKTKRNSLDHVEFAIRLPGRTEEPDGVVWLPIDAKCPQDLYQRLVEAQELADPVLVEAEAKQLEMMIKREAKGIRDKYLDPPFTTDFGVLFLPIEGMYAEVLRRPGLADVIQREFRVLIAGPTTLSALLNSLQMGFRTLVIEKRSSEVWEILGKVKTEFGQFGMLLDKTKKKLQEATNTIDSVGVRSRAIEKQLRHVESLPVLDVVTEALPLISEEEFQDEF